MSLEVAGVSSNSQDDFAWMENKMRGEDAIETLRERLRSILEEKGISATSASRDAGLSLSYVNDILAGKSSKPNRTKLAAVARVLECDVDYLMGRTDSPASRDRATPGSVGLGGANQASEEGIMLERANQKLPLFGVSLPDADGYFSMSSIGFMPAAIGSGGGYAVLVPDDLMEPRYRLGEVVYANPSKPVGAGSFVVLVLDDDRAAIREVVKVAKDSIRVRTIADGEEADIDRSRVARIHRITASGES